jgi:DNA/RNA-binding domain of Phe-tRNA-synthetase-like protein
MLNILIDPSWPKGARMGFLEARHLPALATHPKLEAERLRLELDLRGRHAGQDRGALNGLPAMAVFAAYFKAFGQTYHVLRQLESVALKGRPIASRQCAVTALFMAELQHGIVAAGHDLDRLAAPLVLGAAQGFEAIHGFDGQPRTLPKGDLHLRHGRGILSSLLRGPDRDTPIEAGTRNVLYTLYAPAGIPAGLLETQLQDLARYLRCFAPEAGLETLILP